VDPRVLRVDAGKTAGTGEGVGGLGSGGVGQVLANGVTAHQRELLHPIILLFKF
jgi:hypothetical protein